MVKVYWNSHKRCWSVIEGGRVKHFPTLSLRNCTFHVQEGGRQRVLRDKRKHVHAYVKGEFCEAELRERARRVSYNPYTMAQFHCDDRPISYAELAHFTEDGKVFVS